MKIVSFIVFFFYISLIYSQNPEFFINRIQNETIDDNYKIVTVEMEIKNISLNEIHTLELLDNAIATDSVGNNFESDSFYSDKYYDRDNNYYSITFDSIPIGTNEFKNLKGKFKYLTPSTETGSLIIIKNVLKKFNTNLLDSSKIKIVFMDVDNMRGLQVKNKLQKKLTKIAKKNDLSITLFTEAINDYFEQLIFSRPENLTKQFLGYVENPYNQVVQISLVDPSNSKKYKGNYGVMNANGIKLMEYSYFSPVRPQALNAKIILEKNNAIKVYNFELENIKINSTDYGF